MRQACPETTGQDGSVLRVPQNAGGLLECVPWPLGGEGALPARPHRIHAGEGQRSNGSGPVLGQTHFTDCQLRAGNNLKPFTLQGHFYLFVCFFVCLLVVSWLGIERRPWR